MTATYTPKVAKARKTLNEADFVGPHSAIARDAVRYLLADHVRLAEEAVKMHTTIDRQTRKIAKLGERLHEHRVKLAKVQNEAAEHYSERARLLEENEKLRRVAKAAKEYRPYVPDVEPEGAAKYSDMNCKAHALLTALAALEVQNG